MTKTILFTLLLTLASIDLAPAQFITHWGLKAALTSSDLDYHVGDIEPVTMTRRFGFCVGFFVEWFENSPVTLLTQLEYVQKGTGWDIGDNDPVTGRELWRNTEYSRLDYFSIPILAKVTIPAGSLAPYILAGPRVDFLVAHAHEQTGFEHFYDGFQPTLLGGTFGAGLDLETVLRLPVLVEARYNLDFTKSIDYMNVITIRNNSVDLWVGVHL